MKVIMSNRFFSFVLAGLVLSFLIIIGPVQAFNLNINSEKFIAFIGDKLNFNVSASTDSEETIQVNNLTFKIEGPMNLSCSFLPNGTFIDFCSFLEIELIENSSFNFGYGYGYGFPNGILKWRIRLLTGGMKAGDYKAKFFADTSSGMFQSPDSMFKLINKTGSGTQGKIAGCSIRAKDGTAIYNTTIFESRNRLSLFVPDKGAKIGQGTITAQEGKDRVSYRFSVINATKINNSTILFEIGRAHV